MRRDRVIHLAVGCAMLLALLATTGATAAAQGATASLAIHNRICPVEYSGDDIFGDCHGTPQTLNLEFSITGPVSDAGATDDAGNVAFGGLPAGAYDISGGVSPESADSYVYCSVNGDPYSTLTVTSTEFGVTIDVPDGAAVLCDWYNIPYDLSDQDDQDVQGDDGGDGDDGADGDGGNGGGDGEDGGDGAEEPTDEPDVEAAEDPVPLVSFSLAVYNCDSDPGARDPAVVCDPAQGVTVEVTQDDQPLDPVSTDASGAAAIDAEEGSTVVLTEDMATVPPGYLPLSGGVRTIESVADGASVIFVHIRVGAEEAGRLQIVNGSCPTAGDARTEFIVIAPSTSQGASSAPCQPTQEAPFTITGGDLPDDGIVVYTGSDGAWRGALPAESYTVTDDSGASETIEVLADGITVVTAVDFVPSPDGTLLVTKFHCTGGEEAGTTMTVDEAPEAAGPGCELSDGEFRLEEVSDGTAVAVEDFTLGADGEAELTLRTGDYLLTDLASQQTATVTISDATVTAVTVREVVSTS